MRSRFDWDGANLAKCQKHGVSIDEIVVLFEAEPFIAPDEGHSQNEERFIAVGLNRSGRPVFVVFTLRTIDGEERIRPLSARYMHRKEIRHYDIIWREEGADPEDR